MSPKKGKEGGAKAPKGAAGASVRWFVILLGSLLLWLPSGLAALDGHVSLDAALLRYAIALALCSIGVSGVGRLMDNYSREQARKRIEQELAGDGEAGDGPRRRAEDRG
jgi:hypothetical protein